MSAAAVQVPERVSCSVRWVETGPETVAASEPAPIAMSRTTPSTPMAITRAGARARRPRTAQPASIPAGTQAAAILTSGWASVPARRWSGSAPATSGPYASTPSCRSPYNAPTPHRTVTATKSHAAALAAGDA